MRLLKGRSWPLPACRRLTAHDLQGKVTALQAGQSVRTMSVDVRIKLDEFSHETGSEYEAAVGANSVLGPLGAAWTKPMSQVKRNRLSRRANRFQGSSLKLRSDGTAK